MHVRFIYSALPLLVIQQIYRSATDGLDVDIRLTARHGTPVIPLSGSHMDNINDSKYCHGFDRIADNPYIAIDYKLILTNNC